MAKHKSSHRAPRAPMRFSVRLDAGTSWKMQARFVVQSDAERFAQELADRMAAASYVSKRPIIGLFHQNSLRQKYSPRVMTSREGLEIGDIVVIGGPAE